MSEPVKFQDMMDYLSGTAGMNPPDMSQFKKDSQSALNNLQNAHDWVNRWYARKFNRSVIPPGALVKTNPQFLKRI